MDETEDIDTTVEADPELALAQIDTWIDGFFRLLPNIAIALVLLAIFVGLGWVAAWIVRRNARDGHRADLAAVLGSLVKWAIWIAGGMIALTVIMPSLRPADLIAGLGIGSVAVGLAFKDILQNMLSGILILVRRPFEPGDQIAAGPHEGTVEHIETRATKIRTYDGRRVVIPNTDVYTSAVTVNTAFGLRRSQQDVPVALTDDWARAVAVARAAAQSVEGVSADPPADAQGQDVDDLAKIVRVRWWTEPQQATVIDVNSRVRLAVAEALEAEGFTLPRRTALTLRAPDA
jgi:small-conductance mechanosensitive channel